MRLRPRSWRCHTGGWRPARGRTGEGTGGLTRLEGEPRAQVRWLPGGPEARLWAERGEQRMVAGPLEGENGDSPCRQVPGREIGLEAES